MRAVGLICLALCLGWPAAGRAVQQARLELGTLSGANWRARGVTLGFALLQDTAFAVTVQAARLRLPGVKQELRDLELVCPQLTYTPQLIACPQGRLRLAQLGLGKQPLEISFTHARPAGTFSLEVRKAPFLRGTLTAQGRLQGKTWDLTLKAPLQSERLWQVLGALFDLPEFSVGGALNLEASVKGGSDLRVRVTLAGRDLSFSDAAATQAGEGLELAADLDLAGQGQDWKVQGEAKLRKGEIFVAPIYVQQTGQPLELSFALAWAGKAKRLRVSRLRYRDPEVGTLQGEGEFALAQGFSVRELALRLPAAPLDKVRQRYLQTWLEEKQFGGLAFSGELGGELKWGKQGGALQLELAQVGVQDGAADAGFGLDGLSGTLHWQSQGKPRDAPPTRLAWKQAQLWSKISLPAGSLSVGLAGNSVELLSALHLPILDGSLQIDQFSLRAGEQPEMRFSGALRPVSMQLLSQTFGLPELGGQLSGMVPGVRYSDATLNIGGALLLKVFDGDIVIHSLNLRQPFGPQAELNAEVDIKNLDLNTLTRFFEFGDISGRLSGHVKNLHLLDWQPTTFDAYFATPEGDTSSHKISQKAVNSLSSLGGSDVAAALSRSILRIFESFSYDRIGWGCRLENGVCEMYGAETAPSGYYIVKGGGLPRIDVIGYNQRVDWDELLLRLKRVTTLKTGKPTIRK